MDIVEQLRKYQCPENKGCNPVVEYCQCALMDSSADEIERLRKTLERVSNVHAIRGNEGSADIISLAKALLRIDRIVRAALKEKE